MHAHSPVFPRPFSVSHLSPPPPTPAPLGNTLSGTGGGAQPSNLLLNSDCQVKLADFGLARSVSQLNASDGQNPILTDYVATRWWGRAGGRGGMAATCIELNATGNCICKPAS